MTSVFARSSCHRKRWYMWPARQRTEAAPRGNQCVNRTVALTGYTVDASAFPRSRSAELAGGAANCRQICVPPVGNCKNHSPHRGTSLWSLYYKYNSCVRLLHHTYLPDNNLYLYLTWGVFSDAADSDIGFN